MKKSLLFLFTFFLFAFNKDEVIVQESLISSGTGSCHSSSIVEVSPGILCAAWKGTIETETAGIWISFYESEKWCEPKLVVNVNAMCWSPILSKLPSGEIILFYRVGRDPRHTVSLYKVSNDGGTAWSKEEILPAGIVGPTKTKPLLDADGNMICGSSSEAGEPENDLKATSCWIEILSKNQWAKYGPLEIPGKKFGCIEPALFWSRGTLKMVCRDRSRRIGSEGWIWLAESYDQGKTWSELRKTDLPNPDSGVEVLAVDDDTTLLIYNNSHTNRYPLTVALSNDGGNSFRPLFNIEEESGEFPSAVIDSNGKMHITYASQGQIKHVIIDISKIINEFSEPHCCALDRSHLE